MSNEGWYTNHESSDKARHIHSININGYNTWDHWHLIPSSRPVINPPPKKLSEYDIKGGNGIIDESSILRKFSVYSNREGSWEFYVDNDWGYWQARYSEIMDAIHGIICTVVLDDDPSWYYSGTISVDEWKSNKDRSVIVLNYSLYPYKLSFASSIDDEWLWNPFNFETDYIYNSHTESLNDIVVNSPNEWIELTFSNGYFGRNPISPTMLTSNVDIDHPLKVRLSNPELDINYNDFDNGAGITVENGKRIAGFTLSTIKRSNVNTISLKGIGTITFDFRVGRF